MMPNSSSSPTVAKNPPTKSERTEAGPRPVAGDLQQVGSQVEGQQRGDNCNHQQHRPDGALAGVGRRGFSRPEGPFGPGARRDQRE